MSASLGRAVRLVIVLAAAAAGGCSGTATTDPASPLVFWVAPDGMDASSGTEAAPFGTVERARDAARALNDGRRDVVIQLRGGIHHLDRTLSLDARDSGKNGHSVTYRSAPGELATLSGAVPVRGFQPFDATRGIQRAFVGQRSSRQLYVNGRRAARARTEPYPAGFLPAFFLLGGFPIPLGIEYVPSDLNPPGWRDPSTWTNVAGIEAVIVTQWKMMRVPLASHTAYPGFTPDPILEPNKKVGLLTVQEPAWTNANLYLSPLTLQPGMWSFWQVTRFENALEFLDTPGEWYLDEREGWLYYSPLPEEDLASAEVELGVLEALVDARGTETDPVTHVRFEGLTFSGTTWLGPSSANGYVSDQSGFHLVGQGHAFNIMGHDPACVRTPGALRFRHAHDVTLRGNIIEHTGAVGIDLDTGSQRNTIEDNLLEDIGSAAIQLGGIGSDDHHPAIDEQITRDNVIRNNLVRGTGRDYSDAAAVFVGFTENTILRHNTIVDSSWSAIAIGWGWGLLDPGMFPGLPSAFRGEWGVFTTATPNRNNKIFENRIHGFLNGVWDGGAIYTTGAQGTSSTDALRIAGNVASGKRPAAGGNTFYTDGGSRYVILEGNASFDNPRGVLDFGPKPRPGDPLPFPSYSDFNGSPYGGEAGGCVTYGDIAFVGNYLLSDEFGVICPWSEGGVAYPINVTHAGDVVIQGAADVPAAILRDAGVQGRPATIPSARWVLP